MKYFASDDIIKKIFRKVAGDFIIPMATFAERRILSMKKVSVFLAEGFEEIEGLTVVDILRRAGVHTDMVSINDSLQITGAHGITVKADITFEKMDFSDVDMLVLPGGMPGTLHLQEHSGLSGLLCAYDKEDKFLAAICAAPSVLGGLGILKGKKACCYPSFEEKLIGAEVVMEPAIQDGHVITGRGMGNALTFALKLTEALCGLEKAEEVKKSILF